MPRDRSPTILVGLEDHATATAVLDVARRLAAALDATVSAVHVGPSIPSAVEDLAAAAGVEVTLRPGEPVDVLTQLLTDPEVALAVVGCRAEGGPRPAGPVALALVQHATVPVAVVPPATPAGTEPLREVLLPLDGSRETAAAVQPTVAALAGSRLQVTVAHVFDAERVPMFLDQPHHELEAWGQEFLTRNATPDLDLVLRAGRPGEQLLDVVAATDPDLIVLGWSQDLSPGRARTIRRLLTDSPAPLLLVPAGPTHEPTGGPRLATHGRPDW